MLIVCYFLCYWHDPYCCAIQISRAGRLHNLTIGHIPREISRFVFFFLHHGGSVDGKVIDLNRRRSPIPCGGLEIKLKLYFRHASSMSLVEQMKEFISRYNYEWEQPTEEIDSSEDEETGRNAPAQA